MPVLSATELIEKTCIAPRMLLLHEKGSGTGAGTRVLSRFVLYGAHNNSDALSPIIIQKLSSGCFEKFKDDLNCTTYNELLLPVNEEVFWCFLLDKKLMLRYVFYVGFIVIRCQENMCKLL